MKKESSTREMIMDAALTLFSEKGFDGVGVDEIAASIGMKGPAIYYHFKGKDALLEAVLHEIGGHYDKNFGRPSDSGKCPDSMEELVAVTMQRLNFTIHDEKIKKVRRLIAMEQFRNEMFKKLATIHHVYVMEEMYTGIFAGMMEKGLIRRCDPRVLAYDFTAPITLMIHLIDREPEAEPMAMERIQRHIDFFIESYGCTGRSLAP